MSNFNQALYQPAMQEITTVFQGELQTACLTLEQDNLQIPNLLGKSPASAFDKEPSHFAAIDHDLLIDKYLWSTSDLEKFLGSDALSPEVHALQLPARGEAFQKLMAEKEPRIFLALLEVDKPITAKGIRVIDVTDSIPDDPAERQSFCRALAFSLGFQLPGIHVLKLCHTGNAGGGPLLGDQISFNPAASYVVDFQVVKQLWSFAKEKSLSDLIGQVQADRALIGKGKEAAEGDEFLKMVDYCPREVIAKFHSVELWNMLTDLEGKVKEDFAKLPLWKRPEIIDTPPPAFTNHPLPSFDFKPSCSSAAHEGGVKCFLVPDLNEIYMEDEAGGSTTAYANEEKTNSQKRKVEATSVGGEGQAHVPSFPTIL